MAYSGNPKDYSVAVVYGGTSGEREVSLNSGVACADALKEAGFAVDLVDSSVKEDLKKLIDGNYDIAFLALHGKGGEDGTIQGFLETVGIPYTGSGILASAQAVNKGKAKELYAAAGLNVAASAVIGKGDELDDEDLKEISAEIGIPCVVKPTTEGSSLGMTIVHEYDELRGAIDLALSVDEEAMIEAFIEGTELTVGVIGNDDPRAFIGSGDEALGHLADVLGRLRPHVVITYDADGGYGHPDHIRAHELTVAACERLREQARGTADADLWATVWTVTDDDALRTGLDAITVVPRAWTRAGFDDLPSVASDFAVPLSDADVAAKTASLRAHATQVWVGDGGVSMVNPVAAIGAVDASGDATGVWALSNLICQPIVPAEHYRLGTAGDDVAAALSGRAGWPAADGKDAR